MNDLEQSDSRIIWKKSSGRKKLFTKIKTSKQEYRNWNPFRSKLAAALFNGLEIFPFQSDSQIFYFNIKEDTTLNHLSDIIGSKGNINVNIFNENDKKFDIIYLDILDNKNLKTEIINYNQHLKNSGFLMIFLNHSSNTIDLTLVNSITKTLDDSKISFELIQEINLADYFKNNMMILLQKTEAPFNTI